MGSNDNVCEDCIDLSNEHNKKLVKDVIRENKIINYVCKITSGSQKGDNYMGVIHRLNIQGTNEKGQDVTLNLIMKCILENLPRGKMPVEVLYKREVYYYDTILPALLKVQKKYNFSEEDMCKNVKFYKGDLTYLHEAFVMEDANVQGFQMADRKAGTLDFEHVKLVLKNLSLLHASSMALKFYDEALFDEMCGNLYKQAEFVDMYDNFTRLCVERAAETLDDEEARNRLLAFRDRAYEAIKSSTDDLTVAPYSCFCHGDCWTNNILFKYENGEPVDLRLLDWQLVKNATPAIDLMYVLFSSVDQNLRKKHYQQLLDFYYQNLSSYLVKMECKPEELYPKNVFEEHIQRILPFGLSMALITSPIFLSENQDSMDIEAILGKDDFKLSDFTLTEKKSIERFKARVEELVEDFISFGVL